MSLVKNVLAGIVAGSLSLPSIAVLPESGMWAIGAELNGKPGRGIQVDSQGGKTLILTYFGYRPDGTATFMQASGQLQGGKSFTGDLVEFKNGRALAGPVRDGETAGVVGPISVTFESATDGVVSLPGEQPQKLVRFRFEDFHQRLDRSFSVVTFGSLATITPGYMAMKATADALTIEHVFTNQTNKVCTFSGDLVQVGTGFNSAGKRECNFEFSAPRYRIENLQVDEFGMLSGRIHYLNSEGLPFGSPDDLAGVCQGGGSVFMLPDRCSARQLGLE
ncbi:hypothetical protein LJR129_004513 [Acidovorax sp. LjRoot129]|uniref:hypothetical protein n=1 Tax=Acidovorax sp. LjRoot129 TaxID=3342260 RepID=UPI003ED0E1A6